LSYARKRGFSLLKEGYLLYLSNASGYNPVA